MPGAARYLKKVNVMNLLRSMTLTWWQLGMFKAGMLALGVVIGACCPAFFHGLSLPLGAIAIVCLGYIGWLWLRS